MSDQKHYLGNSGRHLVADAWDWLPQAHRDVMKAFAYFARGTTGFTWPSVEKVAARAHVSRHRIRQIIRDLVEWELLESVKPGGGRGNPTKYRIRRKGLHNAALHSDQETESAITSDDDGSDPFEVLAEVAKRHPDHPHVKMLNTPPTGEPLPLNPPRSGQKHSPLRGAEPEGEPEERKDDVADQLDERLRGMDLKPAQIVEVMCHSEAEITAALEYAKVPGRRSVVGSFMWALAHPDDAAAKSKPAQYNPALCTVLVGGEIKTFRTPAEARAAQRGHHNGKAKLE